MNIEKMSHNDPSEAQRAEGEGYEINRSGSNTGDVTPGLQEITPETGTDQGQKERQQDIINSIKNPGGFLDEMEKRDHKRDKRP